MPNPNWSPSPVDTMSLAAIRWFACSLEASAIEMYATDRTTYSEIERILRVALNEIAHLPVRGIAGDEDCPEGYVLCDGLCRPACITD